MRLQGFIASILAGQLTRDWYGAGVLDTRPLAKILTGTAIWLGLPRRVCSFCL